MAENSNMIHFELATPERLPIQLEAAEVMLPGTEGIFAVLPGHTPLLTTLMPGVLIAYGRDGSEHFYAANGGFVEVLDNRVLVLTQTAEHADEIDLARAESARDRAEQRLVQRDPSIDTARAELALHRALARIQAHSRKGY